MLYKRLYPVNPLTWRRKNIKPVYICTMIILYLLYHLMYFMWFLIKYFNKFKMVFSFSVHQNLKMECIRVFVDEKNLCELRNRIWNYFSHRTIAFLSVGHSVTLWTAQRLFKSKIELDVKWMVNIIDIYRYTCWVGFTATLVRYFDSLFLKM